uniref:Uncharacterized protein n=1 Tax=Chenopodium quinoa TaxID=63459 RepID=A0A803MUG8_CHEQI
MKEYESGWCALEVLESLNLILTTPYSKEEVHQALKKMHPSKAPCLDGIHAVFYQRFWYIDGDDVSRFVTGILNGNPILDLTNATNIALIPKKKKPQVAANY